MKTSNKFIQLVINVICLHDAYIISKALVHTSFLVKLALKNILQLATSKGCIAGDLVFQDVDNNYIDCSQTKMVYFFFFHRQDTVNPFIFVSF